MEPEDRRRFIQYQMIQQYQKNQSIKQSRKQLIIIIAIVVGFLLLIGGGIGLYIAFRNDDDSNTDTDTFKVILPNELKNISLPQCTTNTCIKVGEKLLLNQFLSSDNFTMTIKDNLNNIQRMKNGFPLYTTYNDFIRMVTSEDSSPYYLIINNIRNKKYTYYNLNNKEFKLSMTGLEDGNKNIPFISSKIILNGNTYYIDENYDRVNNIKLLVNDNGIPYSTITGLELFNLSKQNKVISYMINSIGYILLTKYSLLVFDLNNKLIGIISTS
jgi:hypothetical protein